MPLARKSAALLSVGGAAVLSHRSAAALGGLADDGETIAVTVAGSNSRPRSGVRIHRVSRLADADVAPCSNLSLTAPAQTLIDLAAHADSSELHAAFAELALSAASRIAFSGRRSHGRR